MPFQGLFYCLSLKALLTIGDGLYNVKRIGSIFANRFGMRRDAMNKKLSPLFNKFRTIRSGDKMSIYQRE